VFTAYNEMMSGTAIITISWRRSVIRQDDQAAVLRGRKNLNYASCMLNLQFSAIPWHRSLSILTVLLYAVPWEKSFTSRVSSADCRESGKICNSIQPVQGKPVYCRSWQVL